jgi:hypothetical protein
MQTVQFQCGNCGGMMGVGHEFLGQQVRCPSCQQVVVAPTASAPESAPSADGNVDDLFLANLETAPIGDPPKPEAQPAPTSTGPTTEALQTSEPAPATEPAAAAPVTTEPVPAPQPVAASESGLAPDSSLPWNDPAARATESDAPVARAQRQAGGGMSWLWLLPLLSYSILTSVILVILYTNLETSKKVVKDLDERIKKQQQELDELRKMRGIVPD